MNDRDKDIDHGYKYVFVHVIEQISEHRGGGRVLPK